MVLTIGCARCYDHKHDLISQKEYYQLIAYFNNVPEPCRSTKYGNLEACIKRPHRGSKRLNRRHTKRERNANSNLPAFKQKPEHCTIATVTSTKQTLATSCKLATAIASSNGKETIRDLRFYNRHTLTPENAVPHCLEITDLETAACAKRQSVKLESLLSKPSPVGKKPSPCKVQDSRLLRFSANDDDHGRSAGAKAHLRLSLRTLPSKRESVKRNALSTLRLMPKHFPRNRIVFAGWWTEDSP